MGRLWWLKRLAFSGQPAPERVATVRAHPGTDLEVEATEVLGQRRLLQWTVPGVAHALTFWGFSDRFSWISETQAGMGAATLLDEKFAPKPAFFAVQRALGG